MAIELSNLTFTNQADVVPPFGMEEILNTGVANTLAGNEIITGTSTNTGIYNSGTINTGDGIDTITGTSTSVGGGGTFNFAGIFNFGTNAIIDTGTGSDRITATGSFGIYNSGGTINTSSGKDIITIIGNGNGVGIYNDMAT
jgi:hypothetical protein